MITIYHPEPQATPTDRARRQTGEAFWLWREMRRYEYMAVKWREAGSDAYADLCDRWAEQVRLEIAALAEVEVRIAALDRTLKGGAA